MDPVLLAGMDDADDEDTSFAGVHDEDTSFAGVPVPNTTNDKCDNNLDTESDHNSVDPNEAKVKHLYTARSHLSIHSATILQMRKTI